MFEYHISTGTILHNGKFLGSGYSGNREYRNNPRATRLKARGPIPRGRYIIGSARKSPTLGPLVMNLDADNSTDTFGRYLFRIHGDNARHDASHGCIILGPSIRRYIANSGDKVLIVKD